MSNAALFTSVAREYAEFRPGYPPELFAWLAADENGIILIVLTTDSLDSFELGFMDDGFAVWLGAASMRTSPPTKPS